MSKFNMPPCYSLDLVSNKCLCGKGFVPRILLWRGLETFQSRANCLVLGCYYYTLEWTVGLQTLQAFFAPHSTDMLYHAALPQGQNLGANQHGLELPKLWGRGAIFCLGWLSLAFDDSDGNMTNISQAIFAEPYLRNAIATLKQLGTRESMKKESMEWER